MTEARAMGWAEGGYCVVVALDVKKRVQYR